MVDYRYHLASLASVFLALGVGILIGNTFVGQTSATWQKGAIERLGREVAEVQRSSERILKADQLLRAQMRQRDQAERALATTITSGILTGHTVALVATGDMEKSEALGQLTSVLRTAGAEVLSTTYIADDWLPDTQAERDYILRRLQVPDQDPGESTGAANKALARALVSGIWSQALKDVARRANGVALSGDYTRPAEYAVLLSSAADEDRLRLANDGETPDSALLEVWKELGVRAVGAEPTGAPVSLVPVYQRGKVPTVDNIDTPAGQAAVVLALASASYGGDFGTKASAQRVLPEVPVKGYARPGEAGRLRASLAVP
ncbi:MAG TPA: copper transporter [Armatimonadota bacterium]